jgi:hypothetical protein
VWFADADVPREEATVTMDYYLGPSGRSAVLSLYNGEGKLVAQIEAEKRGSEPSTLVRDSSLSPPGYPMYEVITFAAMPEVIEHRRQEPIFYINTDPEVRRALAVQ